MTDIAALDKSAAPTEKFQEYLRTKGQRLTRERAIIVEEVFSSHEHFDTDVIIERVTHRTDSRRVSRAPPSSLHIGSSVSGIGRR